ncbi:MAG: type I restriction enzyme HsdR N-terminal domain-containing protein, partial [Flavobacterium sp.]
MEVLTSINQPTLSTNMKLFKNGKECLLCQSRRKLIISTPEEMVRQQWIRDLIEKYHVPANMIEVEIPLSAYDSTLSGRVDILVSGIDKTDNKPVPLLIIECKAPNVPLTDAVEDQALSYDELLQPKVTVISNGQQTKIFQWDDTKGNHIEINQIPLYHELLTENFFTAKESESSWKRPNHLEIELWELKELHQGFVIGVDTGPVFYSFITNLIGLFLDDNEELQTSVEKVTRDRVMNTEVDFEEFSKIYPDKES